MEKQPESVDGEQAFREFLKVVRYVLRKQHEREIKRLRERA